MMKRCKILYAASTASHLQRFHMPYINALRAENEVRLMASEGEDVDFPIPFEKSFFSFSNFRSILKIRKILKKEQFDKVIVNTTLAAFLIRMAMLGMPRKKRPYVLNIVHGYLFPADLPRRKDKLLLWCERFLRNKTDALAVMNEEDYRIALAHQLCRGDVTYIHGMGVTIPTKRLERDETLRSYYTRGKKDFLCTYVGELSGRKNQEFLICAAKQLYEEGIPIRLLLLGEGANREYLENLIRMFCMEDRIFMPGSREDVYPYLAITDLYVSASESEGLPFNVMEAMACGLPVLLSDTKGQRDLMQGNARSLYPLNDANAFCDEIKSIYASGIYGMGSHIYPILEDYLLVSVYRNNMLLLGDDGL